MIISLSIWDIVANALIEIVERTGKRSVSMSTVDRYFKVISDVAGQEGMRVVLDDYNRLWTNDVLKNLFTLQEFSDDLVIKLNDGVSSLDLRRVFRVKLTPPLMKICADKRCIGMLLACI